MFRKPCRVKVVERGISLYFALLVLIVWNHGTLCPYLSARSQVFDDHRRPALGEKFNKTLTSSLLN